MTTTITMTNTMMTMMMIVIMTVMHKYIKDFLSRTKAFSDLQTQNLPTESWSAKSVLSAKPTGKRQLSLH